MDNPNYVLKANESVLMPQNKSNARIVVKIGIWIVIGLIVMGSIIFQDNLLSELSWTARIFLTVIAIGMLFSNEKEIDVPSPMELQFFDSYFVFYLPKRYYDKRVTRKQINTMKYCDVTRCVYKTQSCRVQIYGSGTSIWYNYDKNGNLPISPTENKNFTDGMIFFSTRCATEVDFKKEIEEHSPIEVIVENS